MPVEMSPQVKLKSLAGNLWQHPLRWAGLALLLVAVMSPGLLRLRVNLGFDGFLYASDTSMLHTHRQIAARYGHESVALAGIPLEDELYDNASLERLDRLRQELSRVEGVSSVRSLFDVPVQTNQGIRPFGDLWEETSEPERKSLLERSSSLLDHFAGPDRRHALFVVEMDEAYRDPQALLTIGMELETLTREAGGWQIGEPYYLMHQRAIMLHDSGRLIPAALVGFIILIAVAYRRAGAVAFPLLTSGASIAVAFAFMGWCGMPISIFTFAIPILLLLVGSTEDLFLINAFQDACASGHDGGDAYYHTLAKLAKPLAATAFTTAAGFFVVGSNPVSLLSQFGLTLGVGFIANFMLTLLISPLCLRYAKPHKLRRLPWDWSQSAQWLQRMRTPASVLLGGLLLATVLLLPRLRVDNDFFSFFTSGSESSQRLDQYMEQFPGPLFFNVTLQPAQGDFRSEQNMRVARDMRKQFRQLYPQADVRSLDAYMEDLARMRSFQQTPDAYLTSPGAYKGYLAMLRRGEHQLTSRLVANDYKELRWVVAHPVSSSTELRTLTDDLEHSLQASLPEGWRYSIAGQYNLITRGLDAATWASIRTFPWMSLFCILLLGLFFRSPLKSMLAVIPSLLSLLLLAAYSILSEQPVNIVTSLVPLITIALAIDHAIHLLAHAGLPGSSLQTTFRENSLPILGSFTCMAILLLATSFSAFGPVATLGRWGLAAQMLALLITILILPWAFAAKHKSAPH